MKNVLWLVFVFILPILAWAEYAPKGKRDPFVPLVTIDGQRIHPPGGDEEHTATLTAVEVQGVIFDPHAESFAVINGRLVKEHEEIDGVKILKIEPTQVTVLVDGQMHQVSVRQPKKEENREEP